MTTVGHAGMAIRPLSAWTNGASQHRLSNMPNKIGGIPKRHAPNQLNEEGYQFARFPVGMGVVFVSVSS